MNQYKVVFAVSWPIPYKNPMRKLFFNIGFQFNYGEPFALSSFYNATYFQNPFENRAADSSPMHDENSENEPEDKTEYSTIANEAETTTEAFRETTKHSRNGYQRSFQNGKDKFNSDLTAAQLYESIEHNLFQ